VAPLIFYFEKVLAKSEQGARRILVLNKDDGTVPENQLRALRKTFLIMPKKTIGLHGAGNALNIFSLLPSLDVTGCKPHANSSLNGLAIGSPKKRKQPL